MSADGRRLKENVKFYLQELVSEGGGRTDLTKEMFSSQLISADLKFGDLWNIWIMKNTRETH
jgi:hypothetical protein